MVGIKEYVESLRSKGYNNSQIKDHLMKYNYNTQTIEKALNPQTINLKKILIISVISISIIITLILFVLFIKPSETELIMRESSLSANYNERVIISDLNNINSGDDQSFLLKFLNFQGNVVVSYDIILFSEERLVYQTTNEISFLYSGEEKVVINKDYLSEGNYKLKISVKHNDLILENEKDFSVISKESLGRIRLAEESSIQSIEDELEKSFDDARKKCLLSFDSNEGKDKCLLRMAILSNKEIFCDNIFDVEKRDNCYYNVAIKEEKYFLCEKINNAFMKKACMP